MAICSAQVITRSNSDLCNIDTIASNTSLSPEVRMQLILSVAQGWDSATDNNPTRHGARKAAAKLNHIGTARA